MSLTFLITALVIVVTPGLGALFTMSAGLARGARADLVAAFGCTLGIVPHLSAAITGTAALLRTSGVAFEGVKALGVAYLLYMAWSTWRDRSPLVIDDQQVRKPAVRVIGSAILANLLNPKLTIFFFAFLPQFVPTHSSHRVGTMLTLSAVFMAMTFAVFAVYGVFAAGVRRYLIDRPRVIRRLRKTIAASFVLLSAKTRHHRPLTEPHTGQSKAGGAEPRRSPKPGFAQSSSSLDGESRMSDKVAACRRLCALFESGATLGSMRTIGDLPPDR